MLAVFLFLTLGGATVLLPTQVIDVPELPNVYFGKNGSLDLDGERALVGQYDPFAPNARFDRAYWVDLETGTIDAELVPPRLGVSNGFGRAVAVFGDRAIVGHDAADRVHVYSSTGEFQRTISGGPGFGRTLRATRDRLVVTSDGSVSVLVGHALEEAYRIDFPGVYDVDVEHDHLVVSSGYSFTTPATVQVFDANTGAFQRELAFPVVPVGKGHNLGPSVSIIGDQVLATLDSWPNGQGRAYVFDLGTGALVDEIQPPCVFGNHFGFEASHGPGGGVTIGETPVGSGGCVSGQGALYVFEGLSAQPTAILTTEDLGWGNFGFKIAHHERRVISNGGGKLLVYEY